MMENKVSKNRKLLNAHFGIMPKIPHAAWKEVAECAKKATDAVKKLSEAAKGFKGPDFKQKQ